MTIYCCSNQAVLRRPLEPEQYTSIRYTERLIEAGAQPSIGSVGDSYDNALAESIIGLFKTELIRRKAGLGGISTPSNWPPWNGSTGTTIGACLKPSETFPGRSRAQHYLTTTPSAILQMGKIQPPLNPGWFSTRTVPTLSRLPHPPPAFPKGRLPPASPDHYDDREMQVSNLHPKHQRLVAHNVLIDSEGLHL